MARKFFAGVIALTLTSLLMAAPEALAGDPAPLYLKIDAQPLGRAPLLALSHGAVLRPSGLLQAAY